MEVLRKIPHQQLVGFYRDHYAEPPTPLRLGQHFLNRFYYSDINPMLYYEESDEIARQIIESDYVEYERKTT